MEMEREMKRKGNEIRFSFNSKRLKRKYKSK